MAEIIPFARRVAWLQLKRFVESGGIVRPKIDLPKPEQPQSDAAIALAYALERVTS